MGFWSALSELNPLTQVASLSKTFMYVVGFIIVLIIVLIFAGVVSKRSKMTGSRNWLQGPAVRMQDVDDALIGSKKSMKYNPNLYEHMEGEPFSNYYGSMGSIIDNPGDRYYAQGNIGGHRYGVAPNTLVNFNRAAGH